MVRARLSWAIGGVAASLADMPWELLVDVNEQAHAARHGSDKRQFLETTTRLPTRTANLEVGDYALTWIADGADASAATVRALIEFKKKRDMLASILDKRYVSQAGRLVACGVPHAYWVVVDDEPLDDAADRARVERAIVHLASPAYPNITPLRVANGGVAFADAVAALADYLSDVYEHGNAMAEAPLHTVVQEAGARVKLDTQEVVWREQLTVPRGMSLRTARAVSAVYPTAISLLRAFRRRADEHAALPPPPAKGRKRKETTLEQYLDDTLADVAVPGAGRLGPARSATLRRVIVPNPTELDAVRP